MKFKTLVLLVACSINLLSQTIEKWGTIGSSVGDCLISKTESNLVLTEPNGNKWDLKKKGNTYVYNGNNITITAEYINYKLLKITQNKYASAMGISSNNTSVYRLVKDMSSDLDKPSETLKQHGLIFRYTFNYGKIGEDYVPEYTKTYNAGKKFYIAGIEVQEKDMRSYTTDGGYNKDVMGYTYVSQIINPTNNVIKINYTISGNAKYPNIEKTGFWDFSYDKYKTIDEYKEFSSQNFIVLKPQENYKDQIKVGVTKPIDLEFIVSTVEVLDAMWIQGLEAALKTQNDLAQIYKYLSDQKASDWHQQLMNQKDKIQKSQREQFHAKYKPFVKTSIKPKDALLYDKDFESEVIVTIQNTSDKQLIVKTKINTEKIVTSILLPSESSYETIKIKGFAKDELKVEIVEIYEANAALNKQFGIVKDIEGNEYKTIVIGNQTWMAEDLKVKKYSDATPISQFRMPEEGGDSKFYIYYNNDSIHNEAVLYSWYAATNEVPVLSNYQIQGVCPIGWHIPSNDEWTELVQALGGETIAGEFMKSEIKWTYSIKTNMKSGFNAIPNGYMLANEKFSNGILSCWWTSSLQSNDFPKCIIVNQSNITLNYVSKRSAMTVRCLKD